MSGEPVILLDGVSKMYHKRAGMGTLFSMIPGFRPRGSDEFWALKDVSFEVKAGERLGIIGPNGAGKSTILKILSRVTPATSGTVRTSGRLASLIEVGAGFHPEMTGRENIFLNGAILGMTRQEIKSRFEAIVEFAELGEFIDVPVKRYSSGMYVRLGFSVAAHLVTDILLVDEVLAVGDAAFQAKCVGKMDAGAEGGRTVVFVSHNMASVRRLCSRALLVQSGRVVCDGSPAEVIQAYLERQAESACARAWPEGERPGNGAFEIVSVTLRNASGEPATRVNISEAATVEIEYEVLRDGVQVMFSLVLFDGEGDCVFGSLSNVEENAYHGRPLRRGRYVAACRLYGNLLNDGRYLVSVTGASQYWSDAFHAEHVLSFEAADDGVLKRDYSGGYGGTVRPKLAWRISPLGG